MSDPRVGGVAPSGSTAALLASAWAALGGRAELLQRVRLTGDPDGLLPSVLPALSAVMASVCCSTLAAAVLDSARTGAPVGVVTVDCEHVAVAARSERYVRSGDAPAPDLFAPLSRCYETGDGWLRLHANYPWHRRRALTVLGFDASAEPSPTEVASVVRDLEAEQLEDDLAAAGALGFAVRTRAQWLRHPHGTAVAGVALLNRAQHDGSTRPPGQGRGAAGFRVLDLTRVIAGPVATRTLAAWGADVLRLDSPRLPEIPAQAVDVLPGKRSALLDLAEPAGRARLDDLLATADVLVQGYRPGALDRYGLAVDDLARRHSHLTVVTLNAWGPTGPWAARRGFDSLVQCPTGIAHTEGHDGRPGTLPAQVLDPCHRLPRRGRCVRCQAAAPARHATSSRVDSGVPG